MTKTQPEVLKILDDMEIDSDQGNWDGKQIKAEMRRLHEVNQELLEAYKALMSQSDGAQPEHEPFVGLTLDERLELAQDVDWAAGAYCEYAEKIEAKLKAKNERKEKNT